MTTLLQRFLAQSSGLPIAQVVLLATACLLATLLATWTLRGAPARWRVRVLAWSFVALLALPALYLFGPRVELPVLRAPSTATIVQVETVTRAVATAPALRAPAALASQPSNPVASASEGTAAVRAPVVLFLTLVSLWFTGFACTAGRQLSAHRELGRRLRNAIALVEPRWLRCLAVLGERLALRREVDLIEGEQFKLPATWGHRRPTIGLPRDAHSWSAERREVVLLHELTHVVHNDWYWRTLARIVCSLWWFHPLVWVSFKQLHLEQERATDEAVIAGGARPSAYARTLLELARAAGGSANPHLQPTMSILGDPRPTNPGRPSQLETRMNRILDPLPLDRSRAAWFLPLALAAGLVALAVMEPVAATAGGSPAQEATPAEDAQEPTVAPTAPSPAVPATPPPTLSTPATVPTAPTPPTPITARTPVVPGTPRVAPTPAVRPTPALAPVPAFPVLQEVPLPSPPGPTPVRPGDLGVRRLVVGEDGALVPITEPRKPRERVARLPRTFLASPPPPRVAALPALLPQLAAAPPLPEEVVHPKALFEALAALERMETQLRQRLEEGQSLAPDERQDLLEDLESLRGDLEELIDGDPTAAHRLRNTARREARAQRDRERSRALRLEGQRARREAERRHEARRRQFEAQRRELKEQHEARREQLDEAMANARREIQERLAGEEREFRAMDAAARESLRQEVKESLERASQEIALQRELERKALEDALKALEEARQRAEDDGL